MSLEQQRQSFLKRSLDAQTVSVKRIYAPAASEPEQPAEQRSYVHLRPTATETNTERHLYSYLYSIISYLKLVQRTVPLSELERSLCFRISDIPDLLTALKNNPKVRFINDANLQYKPSFEIANEEELLRLLRDCSSEGFEYAELADANPRIGALLESLTSDRRVLQVRSDKKDGSIKTFFYNAMPGVAKADEDFCTQWHEMIVPHQVDVQAELSAQGLRSVEVVSQRRPTKSKAAQHQKAQEARRNRMIRITNTHMDRSFDISKYLPTSRDSSKQSTTQ